MIDIRQTQQRLRDHLHALTVTIGERSVRIPENLQKTAAYITAFLEDLDIVVDRQRYSYAEQPLDNIAAELSLRADPKHRLLIGAHYDSVSGTVGADDNASAVAVQLEVARHLAEQKGSNTLDLAVKFVFFCAGRAAGLWNPLYGQSRVCQNGARPERRY